MRQHPTRQIDLAIIGYGKMGRIHARAVRQLIEGDHENYYKGEVGRYLARLRLAAVVDPSFEDDTLVTDRHPARWRSLEQLLESPTPPEMAVIATPSATHYEIARHLLQRGVSLLIEKPVAPSAEAILQLKDLASRHGAHILPGHVERYNPVTLDIQEMLDYKLYGRPSHYHFRRTSPRPQRIPDSIIVDKLIHDMDLLIAFFGLPDIRNAEFKTDSTGRVVECRLELTHPDGLHGSILSSWLEPQKQRTLTVTAERAEFTGDFLDKKLFVKRYREFPKEITGYANNQVKDQLADFVAHCRELVKPLVSIDDAIASARLIDKVHDLAATSPN